MDRVDPLERVGVKVYLVLHRTDALPPPDGTALLASVPSQGDLRWFIYGVR
jgi:hypothetical protein